MEWAGLGHDPLLLATPAGHPLALGPPVPLRSLRDHGFVGFSRATSPSLHAELRALLARHDVVYAPAIEATEYTTIVGLVAAGEGVALVPAGVRCLQLPGVAYVSIADAEARVALVRLSRVDEPQVLVANAVAELHRTATEAN